MSHAPSDIELAIYCLTGCIRGMASWQRDHSIVEDEGVLFVVGHDRFPTGYSNSAFPLAISADPDEVLTKVADFFRRMERPYILWTVDGLHDDLKRAALEAEMKHISDMPAMLIREPLPDGPAPRGFVVERVLDEKALADFADVSADAYEETGLPPQVMRSYFARPEAVLVPGNNLVLARQDSKAVAAALSSTFDTDAGRCASVCWVGAKPGSRRLGAGEACTRTVTDAAFADGAEVVALEASRMGEPIYRRMGYAEVGRYHWYLGGLTEQRDIRLADKIAEQRQQRD